MADRAAEAQREIERRAKLNGPAAQAGVPLRDDDLEPTAGLHRVAILFRLLAGTLIALMVLQVISGLTSMVEISYGVLLAEAIRLVIFAGLLWGGGDLADLFIKSHYDLRASRILLRRLNKLMDQPPAAHGEPPAGRGVGRGDGVH